VLLSGQEQLLDLRWRVRVVVGKSNESHDLSPQSLQCQAKMARRSDAAKRQDTLAFEGRQW
jgi:hypothetical protein